eukprot:comp18946_c0_seq1/m.34805 comp18946_c0_seq1/g.34805  ORF comp18946_c0_seq1/g.34805 comp18946_c0_seq1/m.34805 type:complete len:188 (+) comp18946_c0_seq1:58-621(+)
MNPGEFEALSMLLSSVSDTSIDPFSNTGQIGRPSDQPNPLIQHKNHEKNQGKNEKNGGKKEENMDIWDMEEVEEAEKYDPNDKRIRPDYEILYKQLVGSHDVYLALDDRDPSSRCSDALLIKISLPTESSLKNMVLDVTGNFLSLKTETYFLPLPLPRKIDEKAGNAKWDSEKRILSITLPIIPSDF